MRPRFDVLVIGNGLTGLAAAGHAARAGFRTASVEPQLFGGLVAGVNHLNGLPSDDEPSGISLAGSLMAENTALGVEQVSATVTGLRRDAGEGGIVVMTDDEPLVARAVIIASGATRKRLNVPGEAELLYRGVSDCADCDGPIFAGQAVVAVGGGDSALQEAAALAGYCERVYLIHRRTDFRARADLVDAALGKANIEVRRNQMVEAVLGTDAVSGVRLRDLDSAQVSELPCAAIFSYVGLAPSGGFVPDEIERDAEGAIRTDASMRTGMRGVFAAGAVRAGYSGLIVDAWSEAETAAVAARALLRDGSL